MKSRLAVSLVLAMLILPLIAPFIGLVIPASAQPQPFVITSLIAVPEGLIGFYLNYSHARTVVGLTGLTLDFYVSKDGLATISPGDVRIARVTVTVDTRDVFGTLKLPDNMTLYTLLGSVSGTLFVKVTDGFRVVVASTQFDLSATKLFRALHLSKTKLAFYENVEFGVFSATNLTIDLRPYGLDQPPYNLRLANFDYNITRLVSEERVYRLIEFNKTVGNYESDVFSSWSDLDSFGTHFTVNFTDLRQFPLDNPERTLTFLGQEFNYEDFMLEYFAGVFKNYTMAIKVDAGVQVNTAPLNFTNQVEVLVSFAWPTKGPTAKTVDIFPSVAVTSVDRNTAGVTGELNVGDRVSFALRNFPANAWILWEAWVYGATLSPKLYTINVTAVPAFGSPMTDASGTAVLPNLPVVAAQYGGRVITYTFQVGKVGTFRGAPATNTTTSTVWREAVKPHVFIWSFDDRGMISTTRPIAPGSYVLVVGRGFIAEPLVFELVRAADGVKIADLRLRPPMVGVLGNGSFAAIVQLPVDTLPPALHGTSVYVVAKGTVTPTNVGRTANVIPPEPGTATLTLNYHGAAAVVYINPTPRATSVASFDANVIELGADVFPYAATWEPEARRVITVEAIGLDIRKAVRAVNVTIESIDSPTPGLTVIASATLATNEPVTFGYFIKTYPVPTLPHTYSGYYIKVLNRTDVIKESVNQKPYAVRINATIAVIDPADRTPKKAVVLAAIEDVEVVGYGWAAGLEARYDIQPIVFAVNVPLAVSGADGSLSGVVRLPLYVTQPGVYRVVVHQTEVRSPTPAPVTLSSFVDISVGVLPVFSVKLVTSAVKLADLPIDVWALMFFDGRLTVTDKIVSVTVEAIVRGVGKTTIALDPEPRAAPKAIYYGSIDLFRTFGAAVKGKDVVLVATAIGRFAPTAPLQEAYDAAVVSIPPVTLAEIIEAVAVATSALDQVLGSLNSLSRKTDDLTRALGEAVSAIRGDITAARSDIEGVRALLVEVNTNVGFLTQAVLSLEDQSSAILAKLRDIDAKVDGISNGVAKLSTGIEGLAELIRSANLSLSKVVVDQAGRVIAALSDSEGRIVGAISTNAKTLSDLITASEGRIRGDVKALSDVVAAFQAGALAKLDSIAGSVETVRADLARLRTDAAATAGVIAGMQATLSRVDTNVGGLVETVRNIASTVDNINKAVPNLATKADVSGAQTAITGAVDRAKSDLASSIESARADATASSRNWGIINAILIIIAIAILAYATFVARRP